MASLFYDMENWQSASQSDKVIIFFLLFALSSITANIKLTR